MDYDYCWEGPWKKIERIFWMWVMSIFDILCLLRKFKMPWNLRDKKSLEKEKKVNDFGDYITCPVFLSDEHINILYYSGGGNKRRK